MPEILKIEKIVGEFRKALYLFKSMSYRELDHAIVGISAFAMIIVAFIDNIAKATFEPISWILAIIITWFAFLISYFFLWILDKSRLLNIG